jgi:hypothetical protein
MNQLVRKLPVSAKIALAPLLVMLCLLAVALQSYLSRRRTATAGEEALGQQKGYPQITDRMEIDANW